MITKNLNNYSDVLSNYTELRIQENTNLSIALLKGNLVSNSRRVSNGVSARVRHNGSWGFSSNAELSNESIKTVLKLAKENAEFLSSKQNKNKNNFALDNYSFEKSFATNKKRLSSKELINFAKEIDNYINKKYPTLCDRNVIINCLDMEKSILTSNNSSLYSLLPRSVIYISLTSEKGGEPLEVSDVLGGRGQFEDVFTSLDEIFPKIDTLYEHLMKKCEGIYAEAGIKDCILDSRLAGILAHEAVGHTTESDLVLAGSVAAHYLNKEVASPLITLVDFANTYNNKTCPMPIYIDDEGTKAEDALIIENGILKGYMHNKESADYFNVKPTGNARAFEFFDEPIVRMRNTAILPGKDKLEDMISSIEDGYYLIEPSNGQADSTSEFMFGVTLGYEIKNGKLGRAIKDTTISGIAFDMLKTVTMVSDDMTWLCGGMCGKKQPIPVGMGGPAIKCKINIGGK